MKIAKKSWEGQSNSQESCKQSQLHIQQLSTAPHQNSTTIQERSIVLRLQQQLQQQRQQPTLHHLRLLILQHNIALQQSPTITPIASIVLLLWHTARQAWARAIRPHSTAHPPSNTIIRGFSTVHPSQTATQVSMSVLPPPISLRNTAERLISNTITDHTTAPIPQ